MKKLFLIITLCFFTEAHSQPKRTPEANSSSSNRSQAQRESRSNTARNVVRPARTPDSSLNVNYEAQPVFLNESQTVHPLCEKPASLECVAHWSNQAVPLVSQSGSSLPPQADYYLPSFVPNTSTEYETRPLINEQIWERFNSFVSDKLGSEEDDAEFYRNRDNPDRVRRVGYGYDEEGNIVYINQDSLRQSNGGYTIRVGTHAFPSTVEEVEEGCFVIEKESLQTEASYCEICYQTQDSLEILPTVNVELNNLNTLLAIVNDRASHNINTKTGNDGDYTEKICSPESHLSSVIDNFNRTCGMRFEDFFEQSYCSACNQSIPIELMMSIMSIESAGACGQTGRSGVNEESLGLFQINIISHDNCTETRSERRYDLRQCLNYPVNNLMSALDILKAKYHDVNPSSARLSNENQQCRDNSWLELSQQEKDYWRRAVSGYNGGENWVTRAIASTVEYERVATEGTDFLRTQSNSSYRNRDVPWETLRQLYFLETLAPSNNLQTRRIGECGVQRAMDLRVGSTGRRASCTISNLAYTESILGRDIQTREAPLVEIWHQYKLNFLSERNGNIQCSHSN